MRILNMNEAIAVAGGAGHIQQPIQIPGPIINNAAPNVTVNNQMSLLSDGLNLAGIIGGGLAVGGFCSHAGLMSYTIKGIDIGHYLASAAGGLFGAVGGYAASKLFYSQVLVPLNPHLNF